MTDVEHFDPMAELQARVQGGRAESQATVIEQTRAATQVVAAIQAAKRWPRDEVLAAAKMKRACDDLSLADQAFWSFPRGRDTLEGPTIHLARALLALWGNAMADVAELYHDHAAGTTEMRAYAIDLETNVTFARTFTVRAQIDTQRGPKKLTSDRDIYENNANLGARRLRECIFDLLPGWYKIEAQNIARHRLEHPEPGKTLAQEAVDAIRHFDAMGISLDRLELRLRKPRGEWTEIDLGNLRVLSGTLKRREATPADLFPEREVSEQEVTGGRRRPAKASNPSPATQGGSEAGAQGGDEPPADGAMFPGSEPGQNNPT